MWVRTHDTWVLWEEHDTIRMLLTGRTVHVCQYWMYGHDQGGDVPGLGLTDRDTGLLSGWIVTSWLKALIGLIEYSYHQGIPSFL
jgi:hypothetical protein